MRKWFIAALRKFLSFLVIHLIQWSTKRKMCFFCLPVFLQRAEGRLRDAQTICTKMMRQSLNFACTRAIVVVVSTDSRTKNAVNHPKYYIYPLLFMPASSFWLRHVRLHNHFAGNEIENKYKKKKTYSTGWTGWWQHALVSSHYQTTCFTYTNSEIVNSKMQRTLETSTHRTLPALCYFVWRNCVCQALLHANWFAGNVVAHTRTANPSIHAQTKLIQ